MVRKNGKDKQEAAPVTKKRMGRPPENKKMWRCVLRLPETTADRLKKAAEEHGVSINMAVETVVDTWLSSEN